MSQGIAPARLAAFEILLKMESGAGHCDELLRTLRVQSLSPQDRNLCTNLVMGTLRWQIALDAQVARLLSRPDVKLTPGVRVALRLGAFQLLHLDRIPAHAAISESVEIAKFGGEGFAAGMVNAVLRKIAVAGAPVLPKSFRSAAELAAAFAHPAWMVERWARFYGMERARRICEFNQAPPPATVRTVADGSSGTSESERSRTADALVEELRLEGIELGPGAFLSETRRLVRGDVTATEAFRQGRVRIQDEASQLVGELAAGLAADLDGRGEGERIRILDCCAAPGGKTAILAERNPDATIVARDVSERRLTQMKRMLPQFLAQRIAYEVGDATDLATHPGGKREFDLVLCDAPCSGTGTLARNPEIRHRTGQESLARHQARQIALLSAAMQAAAPTGRVVYATCSLEPEENQEVVEACLREIAGFRLAPLSVGPLAARGLVRPDAADDLAQTAFDGGCLRTLPGVHPCDGFFAALLITD